MKDNTCSVNWLSRTVYLSSDSDMIEINRKIILNRNEVSGITFIQGSRTSYSYQNPANYNKLMIGEQFY